MQDNPEAGVLLEAVQDFLKGTILPLVRENPDLTYRTLVSWNMLGVVTREIRTGEGLVNSELAALGKLLGSSTSAAASPSSSPSKEPETFQAKMGRVRELNRELVGLIQAENLGPEREDVWQCVKDIVEAKLVVSNPRFLQAGGSGKQGGRG